MASVASTSMRSTALEPPVRLDRAVLERWAVFDERFGILERRPDVDEAFALGLESGP